MPAATVTVTIDPTKIDDVKRVLDRAGDLVEAIGNLKAAAPGSTSPVVLPRPVLDQVLAAAAYLADALGGAVPDVEVPRSEAPAPATGRYQVIAPGAGTDEPPAGPGERIVLRTDDQELAIGVARQRFGRIVDTETGEPVEVPPSV